MTNPTSAEWYLSEEIETGEKTMTCPVSGREFRVTRWAERGGRVRALEKTPIQAVATDGGSELGVPCDVDDCEARIVGLDDGWEFSRGTVCQDCIDYHDRHGHWPDESVDICAECRIDDGMIPHECEECAADRVLIEPGTTCDYCGFEAAMTDGGRPAEDGRAIEQSEVPSLDEAYPDDYVHCKPLPPEHELDDAECHNCGEPWNGGEDWNERHLHGGPSLGEDWKYECPNCGHETFEVGI